MGKSIKVIGSVLLGNALLAFAICAFIVPNGFMLGGSTGIALILQEFFPGVPLSVWSAITNTLLFILGWICLGKTFAAATLLSTIVYPVFLAVFEHLPVDTWFASDLLTCALFASVLVGVGVGIVIRVGGSTGGMDIPPCILQKYKGIPVGTSMMYFDAAIVALQVIFRGPESLLHSLVIIFLSTAAVNRTVVTGEKAVQIIIISPHYEQIRKEVLGAMDTGATMLSIETGYTSQEQKAVFCVTYAKKYPAVRDAVLRVDPKAFIVTTDVKNVNGRGYTLERLQEKVK